MEIQSEIAVPDVIKQFFDRKRLRPILMTTATTVLGLLPMALDRSEGAGLWSPLAITVISGLLSSTILTLLLIPSFYVILEDIRGLVRRLIGDSHRLPVQFLLKENQL